MLTKLFASTIVLVGFWWNLSALVPGLERGDADSAGSTLRTLGIVILVLAIVMLVGMAVATDAGQASTTINNSGIALHFGN